MGFRCSSPDLEETDVRRATNFRPVPSPCGAAACASKAQTALPPGTSTKSATEQQTFAISRIGRGGRVLMSWTTHAIARRRSRSLATADTARTARDRARFRFHDETRVAFFLAGDDVVHNHRARGRHRFLYRRAACFADNEMIGTEQPRQLVAPIHRFEFLRDGAADFFHRDFQSGIAADGDGMDFGSPPAAERAPARQIAALIM